jgi:hypothetical protein
VEELIAFLRARLDEEEAAAKAAGGFLDSGGPEELARDLRAFTFRGGALAGAAIAHIALHGPARVLAEVKAWRRLLLESQLKGADSVYAGTERETGFHLALGLALKSKAMVYSDHPGYRESLLSA